MKITPLCSYCAAIGFETLQYTHIIRSTYAYIKSLSNLNSEKYTTCAVMAGEIKPKGILVGRDIRYIN